MHLTRRKIWYAWVALCVLLAAVLGSCSHPIDWSAVGSFMTGLKGAVCGSQPSGGMLPPGFGQNYATDAGSPADKDGSP